MANPLLLWESLGVLAIVVGGNLLHFLFNWSGGHLGVALFAPVNESVWEHLKMAYWPLLALTFGELLFIEPPPPGLLAASGLGFLAVSSLMIGLYYLSAKLVPSASIKVRLAIDGSIFVLAVAVGQAVGYGFTRSYGDHLDHDLLGFTLLMLPAAVLAAATVRPPRLPIFKDDIDDFYGIPNRELR